MNDLLEEILYHVDCIDNEGFSNDKIKNHIAFIVKQLLQNEK
jgi:hypothetical protein